jgi:hypothetical protein
MIDKLPKEYTVKYTADTEEPGIVFKALYGYIP